MRTRAAKAKANDKTNDTAENLTPDEWCHFLHLTSRKWEDFWQDIKQSHVKFIASVSDTYDQSYLEIEKTIRDQAVWYVLSKWQKDPLGNGTPIGRLEACIWQCLQFMHEQDMGVQPSKQAEQAAPSVPLPALRSQRPPEAFVTTQNGSSSKTTSPAKEPSTHPHYTAISKPRKSSLFIPKKRKRPIERSAAMEDENVVLSTLETHTDENVVLSAPETHADDTTDPPLTDTQDEVPQATNPLRTPSTATTLTTANEDLPTEDNETEVTRSNTASEAEVRDEEELVRLRRDNKELKAKNEQLRRDLSTIGKDLNTVGNDLNAVGKDLNVVINVL